MPQHLDHVSITVRDLSRARPFYDAVAAALGIAKVAEAADALRYGTRNRAGDDDHGDLTVRQSANMQPDEGRHWCLRAPHRAAVDAFHGAGLAAGGRDAGAPGPRPHYHAHYYAAFLYDPDGNKIEAVCHEAP